MGRPIEITDAEILTAARACFLRDGVNVSVNEIALELGVSHTTIFNRFGSKEALMRAALDTPPDVPWVSQLEAGPDAHRDLREQLVEHAKSISSYFSELQTAMGLLSASGLPANRPARKKKGFEPPAMQAVGSLTAWLSAAQKKGLLGKCDVPTLAATLLGAINGWAFIARASGKPASSDAADRYVEQLVELLWKGIAPPR